jgi:hypothetical protein
MRDGEHSNLGDFLCSFNRLRNLAPELPAKLPTTGCLLKTRFWPTASGVMKRRLPQQFAGVRPARILGRTPESSAGGRT